MIDAKTITTILVIVALLVVGIVTMSYINEVFPEAAPTYGGTFAVGSAPYAYDTNERSLTNMVVRQQLSDGSWETIDPSDYTYAGTTVTVDAGALYV